MQLKNSIETYLTWKNTYTHLACSRYQNHLKNFLAYFGENYELENISSEQMIHYFMNLKNKVTQYNKPYSDRTIAYIMVIFKNFFRFWEGRGVKILNTKELIPIRYSKTFKEVVDIDDYEDLLSILSEDNEKDLLQKVIIRMLWETGMRISELLDLNIIDIRSNEGNKFAYIQTKKSKRYNIVVWSKETDEILNKYLGIRLCKDTKNDALFIAPVSRKQYNRLSARSTQRWIKSLCIEAGIDKNITCHSFRHGKAHHMYNNNANPIDIQTILRHTSPTTAQHYLVLNPKKYLELAQKYL